MEGVRLHDIIIIGAGPCGSYIARRLSHLGYRVVVVEENVRAGDDICCTGIISQECLRAFSLDNSLVLREVSSAKFLSPSGKCLRLRRESSVAAIVDRVRLDMNLAEQAQEAGADYLFGAKATDVLLTSDAVKVRIKRQRREATLKAKAAIIATGFGSALPRKLGLGEIKQFVIGAQAEVDINSVDEVEVYFDQNLAPGGFAWLVPTTDGKGLAGLFTRHQAELYIKSLLSTLSRQGKIASGEVARSYGVIPLRPLPKTYADRVLVVGEAAGQVKPTTGGGIYFGLLCAELATNTVHHALLAGDLSSRRFSHYQREWRAEIAADLRLGYLARKLYNKLSNKQIEEIFDLMISNRIPDELPQWEEFSFDWHGRLIYRLLRQQALLAPMVIPKLRMVKWLGKNLTVDQKL